MTVRSTTNHSMAWALLGLLAAALAVGGCKAAGPATPAATPAAPAVSTMDTGRDLFNGKDLAGWKVSDFGGQGKVAVKDGQIVMEIGQGDLTGITWAGGPLPKMNYEATLEAMRLDGGDFFCGFTFPVRESACSLICGGWGGTLVGISSIDGYDASDNETTKFMNFASNRWYRIRVRVTEKKIEAWIDEEQFVDLEPGDRKIDTRIEVDDSKPFGVAAYRTKSALRNIRVRKLSAEDL